MPRVNDQINYEKMNVLKKENNKINNNATDMLRLRTSGHEKNKITRRVNYKRIMIKIRQKKNY